MTARVHVASAAAVLASVGVALRADAGVASCHDWTHVVGYSHCHRFGSSWAFDHDWLAVDAVELDATLSAVFRDVALPASSSIQTFAPGVPPLVLIGAARHEPVEGFAVRLGVTRGHLVLGFEESFALGPRGAGLTSPQDPTLHLSLQDHRIGWVFGVLGHAGRLAVRGEVATEVEIVETIGGCRDQHCLDYFARALVEPRVRADYFVSRLVTIGLGAGIDPFRAGSYSLTLALSGHAVPYGGY